VDAAAILSFPTGAGAIELGGLRQAFVFNPESDLYPRGGEGALEVVQTGREEVVLRDRFEATLRLRNLDLGLGQAGSGQAKVKFSINLAINHRQLIVSGENEAHARIRSAEAPKDAKGSKAPGFKEARFEAPLSPVQTLLDW
jgi:hypothetical protein